MSNAKIAIELTDNTEEEIETSVTIEGSPADVLASYTLLGAEIMVGLSSIDERLSEYLLANIADDIREAVETLKKENNEG
jgi:hypothetical protein